jgi:ribosomal protein L24
VRWFAGPPPTAETDELARSAEGGLSYLTGEALPTYLGLWLAPNGGTYHLYSDYPPEHHERFGWKNQPCYSVGMTNESEAPVFQVGDKVTVMRGKLKGGRAEILSPADPEGQYAVRMDTGALAVLNAVNLKAPAESTIGEAKLAAEISTLIGDLDAHNVRLDDEVQAFVSRLSGARISWPVQSADEIQR